MAHQQATWSILNCPSIISKLFEPWVDLDAMDPASSSKKSEEG